MNDNDIIADYIRDRFPNILETTDFEMYKLRILLRNVINEAIKPIVLFMEGLTSKQKEEIRKEVEENEE